MSEKILRALMQLFAIIAKVDFMDEKEGVVIKSTEGRKAIESFLKSELNASLVDQYIDMFEGYLRSLYGQTKKKNGVEKRNAVNAVKVLRICHQINQELSHRQKIITLLRILEFVNADGDLTKREIDFAVTVAQSFKISEEEFENLYAHVVLDEFEELDESVFLYVKSTNSKLQHAHTLQLENLDSKIRFLYFPSANLIIFRYFGKDELNVNGQLTVSDRNLIFNQGAALRTNKTKSLFFTDVISRFRANDQTTKLVFEAKNVNYSFPSGRPALHQVNLTATTGQLIGIMGASGGGKSTLLNVLNGSIVPSSGKVTINNIDIHRNSKNVEGVIGNINQDDLLIEELTVYENLYYNTQLCYNDLSNAQIHKKIINLLSSIGLLDVKDQKVGSVLEKSISGGQRKRLNIAFELIREPSVLFVDEPTSGLSSRDSETIMDVLKELTFAGKLVFVVIHQPSSTIFKMFDQLLVLDECGYPIFVGNPIDSVVYFKTCIEHANAYESECETCGNVNPEQILNIVEARVLDEYGNSTKQRKISPIEWHERYLEHVYQNETQDEIHELPNPSVRSAKPSRSKQFSVFFRRDIKSKLANAQYLLINALEAPLLAFTLSFFLKFFNGKEGTYSYLDNENIPQFIFVSVIVAIFMGLTVAAEEIIKDRVNLKREAFLNLSRFSYLLSKIQVMFIISAIQTFLFVLIGSYVLEIKGMFFEYWMVLFSAACCSNVMGLIISSTLNSVKVIYISIPIFVIPQLLFSGVIVSYSKLNPVFSHPTEVPWVGNLMLSRWAYEALAVTQAKDNKYVSKIYEIEKDRVASAWKLDYWIPAMKDEVDNLCKQNSTNNSKKQSLSLLKTEYQKEVRLWENLSCPSCQFFIPKDSLQRTGFELVWNRFLENVKLEYASIHESKSQEIDQLKRKIGLKKINQLKEKYFNTSLDELVTNKKELVKLVNYNNELVCVDAPIYATKTSESFLGSPFYAPYKKLFGFEMVTLWSNLIIVWMFVGFAFFLLYTDLLRKGIHAFAFQFDTYFQRRKEKKHVEQSK